MSTSNLHATFLRCNDSHDPLGVDSPTPLLSWIGESMNPDERGQRQTAYRICAAHDVAGLDATSSLLWDTGWVPRAVFLQVPWTGPALSSRELVCWRVCLRDAAGQAGLWSAPARFEMGLLHQRDWSARWIAADTKSRENPTGEMPSPYLRGEFTLPENVVTARV